MPLVILKGVDHIYEFDIDKRDDEELSQDLSKSVSHIAFPILIVPWQTDSSGSSLFVAGNKEELDMCVKEALYVAEYSNPPRVHLFSRNGWGDWWLGVSGELSRK